LSGHHFISGIHYLNEVHAVGQVGNIVLLVFHHVADGFDFVTYEVENVDLFHLVIRVDADKICGRVWVDGNLDLRDDGVGLQTPNVNAAGLALRGRYGGEKNEEDKK